MLPSITLTRSISSFDLFVCLGTFSFPDSLMIGGTVSILDSFPTNGSLRSLDSLMIGGTVCKYGSLTLIVAIVNCDSFPCYVIISSK